MATTGRFLNGEQLECSICMDLYSNPVSLPCGHNFCQACISRHWSDRELRWCPLCKREFNKSLKLRVNTLLRDIVDNYKHALGDSEKPTSPDDVLCDCCLHTRRRASKTCLVCLTSYCKTHLEPHLRVTTLKTHTLTDPVPKLEEKVCTKHNRLLEEVNAQPPVCVECAKIEIQDLPVTCEEKKVKPEKQVVQSMKGNNLKKSKKTKNIKAAPNFYIWFNQQQFTFSHIPSHCGFSRGRVYYDVWLETNSIWELGVVSATLHGKKSHTNGAWIVGLERHVPCEAGCPFNTINTPYRVLVCVDYEQGRMFICNASDGTGIVSLTNCKFRGKLILFAHQSPNSPKTLTQRIQTLSPLMFVLICIAFLFLCFIF